MTRILAFDPAIKLTGFALLLDDGSPDGKIDDAGLIRNSDDQDILDRVVILHDEALAVMDKAMADTIIVETPFATRRGGPHARRSDMSLPTYGVAVGTVMTTAIAHRLHRTMAAEPPVNLITTPADLWSRRIPSGGDEKPLRVRHVQYLYGLDLYQSFARTTAGNVADAVLIARHALIHHARIVPTH